jgi:hypothetical protein
MCSGSDDVISWFELHCDSNTNFLLTIFKTRQETINFEGIFIILGFNNLFMFNDVYGFPSDRQSGRRLSAKLVPNFADRSCCLVSATDPHGC